MDKLTIENVKDFTEQTEYKLLSNDYVNSKTKLWFLCPEGHEFEMRFNNFQQGQRCPICAKNDKKFSYKQVKSFIETNSDCTLLSKDYENINEKLQFKCPEGHIFEMSFNHFKGEQRCPICKINNQKLTFAFVKNVIENNDYKLHSKDYENSKIKLKIECPEGHEFDMSFDSFKSGQRCPVCAGNKKHTIEQVKGFVEKTEYKLLSEEYINSGTKLKMECPKGHEFEMRFSDFQRGQRCPVCAGKMRFSYEQVKDFVEKNIGYKLNSKDYVNIKTKLKIECPEGHEFDMSFDSFQSGHRCPVCAGNKKLTIEQIKEFVEQHNQICLSEEYVNNSMKLEFKCQEGHIYSMSFNSFKHGQRCPICAGNKKHTIEYVKEFVEKNIGYKLNSKDYVNNATKMMFECPEGHEFEMAFKEFQYGQRCPICASKQTSSKGEKEVLTYVESIYKGTIKPNDKTQIINPKTGHGLELDIFMPDINLAIEYNGIYWHSDPYQRYKDEQKVIQCQQKNISLLVIIDKKWNRSKDQIKTEIKNQIGLMTIKKG